MIICPVCNRQQNQTTGIWIAIDAVDALDLPNYYMCSDCYEAGRKAYRESLTKRSVLWKDLEL